jgi:hypothetical protein
MNDFTSEVKPTEGRAVIFPRMFGWRSLFAYIFASQLIILLTYTGYLNEMNAKWISLCYIALAGKSAFEILMPKGAPKVEPYLYRWFGWRTVGGFLYAAALYLFLTYTGYLNATNSEWLGMQFLGFAGKSAAEYASNIRSLFSKSASTGPESGEF